jgi:hypothetical protein
MTADPLPTPDDDEPDKPPQVLNFETGEWEDDEPEPTHNLNKVPLTPAQLIRKEQRQRVHFERQSLYPKGTRRRSPRLSAPKVPRTTATSLRVCVENPQKTPAFAYLYQMNTTDEGGRRVFRFYLPGAIPMRQTFTSIYDACVHMHKAGYLDASW